MIGGTAGARSYYAYCDETDILDCSSRMAQANYGRSVSSTVSLTSDCAESCPNFDCLQLVNIGAYSGKWKPFPPFVQGLAGTQSTNVVDAISANWYVPSGSMFRGVPDVMINECGGSGGLNIE